MRTGHHTPSLHDDARTRHRRQADRASAALQAEQRTARPTAGAGRASAAGVLRGADARRRARRRRTAPLAVTGRRLRPPAAAGRGRSSAARPRRLQAEVGAPQRVLQLCLLPHAGGQRGLQPRRPGVRTRALVRGPARIADGGYPYRIALDRRTAAAQRDGPAGSPAAGRRSAPRCRMAPPGYSPTSC